MKSITGLLSSIFFSVFTFLLLALLVGGVYTQTDSFRQRLGDQALAFLNEKYPGEFSADRVNGRLWDGIVITGLGIGFHGNELVQVPRLEINYNVFDLLKGEIRLSHIFLDGPRVTLTQDPEGRWDLLQAFVSSSAGSSSKVVLDSITVINGSVRVVPNEFQHNPVQLADLMMETAIKVQPNGLQIDIKEMKSRLTVGVYPQMEAKLCASFENTSVAGSVDLHRLNLTSASSRLQASGRISDLNELQSQLEVSIDRLAAADVAKVVPQSPLKEDINGRITIAGTLSDLQTHADLRLAGAKIRAKVKANLKDSAPHYAGHIAWCDVIIEELLSISNVGGETAGTLKFNGNSTRLDDLQAEATLSLKDLKVTKWRLGSGSMTAKLLGREASIHGQLRGVLGGAKLTGDMTLMQQPEYEFDLAIDDLALDNLYRQKTTAAGNQAPPTGHLNLVATVKGRGIKPRDMDTRVRIAIKPSRLGPVVIDQGQLVSRIANGRIDIKEGQFTSQGTTFAINGQLSTQEQPSGELTYHLLMPNAAPWLVLVGQKGASGTIKLDGKISGNLQAPTVTGQLSAKRFSLGTRSIDDVQVVYALEAISSTNSSTAPSIFPSGRVSAKLSGIDAGVSFASTEISITLPDGKNPSANISIHALDAASRPSRLALRISRKHDHLEANLNELLLSLPTGAWQLDKPTVIVKRGQEIRFDKISVHQGDQKIAVTGRFSLSGQQALTAQIEKLQLENLGAIVHPKLDPAGQLSARVEIDGSADSPIISATATVTDLRVAGREFAKLNGQLDYNNELGKIQLGIRQDGRHQLNASGTLPLVLRWNEGFYYRPLGDLDAHIYSAGLNVAMLNPMSTDALRDLEGLLTLDLRVDGAITQPELTGRLAFIQGHAAVPALGLIITPININSAISPQHFDISEFSMQTRGGSIQGSGSVSLKGYRPQQLTAKLTADRWPAIWNQQYKIALSGRVEALGTPDAPKIAGQIDIVRAILQPELAFLQDKPIKRDPSIVVLRDGKPLAQTDNAKTGQNNSTNVLKNLGADLTLRLRNDIVVLHPNAKLELDGSLRLTKVKASEPSVVGSINVTHGWAGLHGRRFEIRRGKVQFTGGKTVEPRLDVLAHHQADEYLIKAMVDGTVSKPRLRLQSDPALEQADILSVLLLGKRASALGSGEKVDLQQKALTLASGYAATAIGKSISEALGLKEMGIDLGDLNFSGGSVGITRYISPKTRLSFTQDLTGKEGQSVSIEYQIAPGWEIHTSTRSNGESGADVIWRKRY